MKKFNLIFISLLTLLVLVSCENSINEVVGSVDVPTEYAELNFDASASQQTIQFTTTSNWSIALAETKASIDWAEIYPTSGEAGTSSITITLSDNTTNENREATLTITSGDSSQEITIVQITLEVIYATYSNYNIEVNPATITVISSEGQNYLIQLTPSQDEWSIYSSQSWLELTTELDDDSEYILAEVSENVGLLGRKSYAVLSIEETSSVLAISQLGIDDSSNSADLVIDPSEEKTFYPTGGWCDIDVTTQLSWSSFSSQSWATLKDVTIGVGNEDTSLTLDNLAGNGTTRIYIDENESVNSRQVVVIFSTEDHSEAMIIKQQGVEFSIDPEELLGLGSEEQEHSISIESNYKWEVKCDADWIEIDKTDGGQDDTISIKLSKNTLDEKRETVVVFTSGSIMVELPIEQEASEEEDDDEGYWLEIDPDTTKVVSGDGDIFFITVNSNIAWGVVCPEVWISTSVSLADPDGPDDLTVLGYNDGVITVAVAENETGEPRSTTLVVTGVGDVSEYEVTAETLTIVQYAKDTWFYTDPEDKITVEWEESTFSLPIISNLDWTVVSYPDWVTIDTASGSNNATISVTVSENSSTLPRNGHIVFSTDICLYYFSIYQNERTGSWLEIDPEGVYKVDSKGETINVDVESNIYWSISGVTTWAYTGLAASNSDGTVSIRVSENLTSEARSTTIQFSGDGIVRTITIEQESQEVEEDASLVLTDLTEVEL